MLNKSFYIVLAGAVMAVSGANAAGTQVQTVQSTDRAYEPVETRLSTVTTQVDGIITTTETQKTDITGLLNSKQNRPSEDCEEGKNCLLVKDASGTEHWYPIIDCGEDSFLSGLNFDGENISFGPGEPWGWRLSSQNTLMCQNSAIGCQSGEWVTSYNKNSSAVGDNIVFGVMRRVAIAESTPGTIVTLPNNVANGDVCVCKATKYKTWDASASRYGDGHDITTDKWLVIGNASDDENCMHLCADERNNSGGSKLAYYASIGNTCSAPAVEAQMCRYHSLFGTVAELVGSDGYTMSGGGSYAYGSVREDGTTWTGCAPDATGAESLQDTGHCSTSASNRGTWVTKYFAGSNRTNLVGYIYGFGGYVTVPAGTSPMDVIDVNVADVSTDPTGHNAAVCVIKGYKAAGDASDTNLTETKAFVAVVSNNLTQANAGGVRSDGCAELSVAQLGRAYSDLAGVCFAY